MTHLGETPLGPRQLVRPVLLALGVVVFIFIAYELVERIWLSGREAELLYRLHRTRGLVSSLVAALLTAWFILRHAPPLLGPSARLEELSRAAELGEVERLAQFARWFITMRWIAVLAAGLLVFFAVRVAEILPSEVWSPLVATVAALAALNAVYLFLLRRGYAGRYLLVTQAYLDLGVLTILLHFAGGAANPLAVLMLFHVIIAGIVLDRWQCFSVAGTGSMLFALLSWAEWRGALTYYPLGIFPGVDSNADATFAALEPAYVGTRVAIQAVTLLVTAYFTTSLTDRIRDDERQLKRFAGRLLAQTQLLERALDTTGTGLRVRDRGLRPYWANRLWESWGLGNHTAVPQPDAGVRPDAGRSAAEATLTDGVIRVGEIILPPGPRTFRLTTAPLVAQDGEIGHVVELAQEITDQKKAQAQLVQAEKLAAIGRLAGQIAHEVNNPIAIISAKTRLLLSDYRGALSERIAQELAKITELADRVARITQGLLSYARPSPATRAPLDPRIPIRKALAMVEPTARAAGVEAIDRLPARVPLVHANAGELEQVFLNLFLNALDAMTESGPTSRSATSQLAQVSGGGAQLIVSARTEQRSHRPDQQLLVIEVEDTGIGIPEEIRDRIFEPFLTTKPAGKGTGLGLSICQGLIRSHGGEIDIDRAPERGTRVTVRLPVSRPVAEEQRTSHL